MFGTDDPATVDLGALGQRGFRIDGTAGSTTRSGFYSGDAAGASVAGAGDLNGDGRADVLVGAPGADNHGRSYSGSAYVVYGGFTPDTRGPKLALRARSPQRAVTRSAVLVRAVCNETCWVRASGTITIPGKRTRLPLRKAGLYSVLANRVQTLRLNLAPATRNRLARLLEQGNEARASVTVRAEDRAGNVSWARRTVALRR